MTMELLPDMKKVYGTDVAYLVGGGVYCVCCVSQCCVRVACVCPICCLLVLNILKQ
jgi:uncharacterized membrane protein